ncbi:fructose-specific PTS transporter subunit EIIC [Ruminococcus flavefaciens]|uniref:PTS fructose transporter subunit IIABC n=1 Tax=Ruminococcus flavefaciens TaxID=1265 RepID=UPI0026EE4AB5|nr:fructose-specific PTS transporter subunit EIIC [Ruminococcus flavefaciens]MDD7515485.1 fructose-specific PTS transporter subunit EIIC [Ruminococcus flavefaciens]MDY5692682.1 fructose-specific PTS transporter subunit EIIC [Ruminococcus flavefaciens]
MRIVDLLSKNSIKLNASPKSKSEAIDMLIDLQVKGGNIADKEAYKKGILAREEKGSTAVGEGIAIPHAKSEAVKAPSLAAMTVPDGVDYEALDDEPSNLLFMIAAPNDGDVHLEVLSRLMTILMDEDFRDDLLKAKDADEFLKVIDDMEKEKYPDEPAAEERSENGYKVLAVTACPTGIAHTHMAAEALEKAGKKLGISIKVETNGSGGAKNILTQEEIDACDGIIVAADKTVSMARFNGKKVIKTKVSDGIKIPEELINRIEAGDAPVYHHEGEADSSSSSTSDSEGFGRKLYKHLMNGVSNMLPFTVAGGIFIAIAFLIDSFGGAPQDGDFGSHLAAAAWFKTIGNYAFQFMIPVLAGYIGLSIADRPGFLVGMAGGAMAAAGATFASPGGDVPSGFLGALLAGFIGGYLTLCLEKACNKLPKALNGIKPVLIYPLGGLAIVGIMMCAVNPVMGILNDGLSNFLNSMGDSSKVLLGCILGGMMAIDMGGPFNKAAYVFGVAAISQGNFNIMAAVMLGGMVPPIAIALATTFFKNRFTEEERKNGPVNYIMGLSFITEGAIPYAAADPARVIPSCIVGAATAGGISMAFGCTLRAPHGGIFVFPVVGHPLQYVIALAIGSVVGMLMLALLKKKHPQNA